MASFFTKMSHDQSLHHIQTLVSYVTSFERPQFITSHSRPLSFIFFLVWPIKQCLKHCFLIPKYQSLNSFKQTHGPGDHKNILVPSTNFCLVGFYFCEETMIMETLLFLILFYLKKLNYFILHTNSSSHSLSFSNSPYSLPATHSIYSSESIKHIDLGKAQGPPHYI